MVPDKNARLLLVSSQASPPSSCASFQKSIMNFTESTDSFELSTTFLPSASTSLPPQDQRYGYVKVGASPNVWPRVCPIGWPAALSFLPSARYSSQLAGKLLAPCAANHDLRYTIMAPSTHQGTPSHRLPSFATAF